jgi:adenylate cyclase
VAPVREKGVWRDQSTASGRALRCGAASVLAARATLTAALEAHLGRRSAARVMATPLRRDIGETIQAALLCADLRGFTELSESSPPSVVISALGAWFDRIAGAVHAFGGEVLKFIGNGVLSIFPVAGGAPRDACDAALRAVSSARVGMAHLDKERRRQGLPPLPFGAALHLGEMRWGNIGAADRLDFTAIGPGELVGGPISPLIVPVWVQKSDDNPGQKIPRRRQARTDVMTVGRKPSPAVEKVINCRKTWDRLD